MRVLSKCKGIQELVFIHNPRRRKVLRTISFFAGPVSVKSGSINIFFVRSDSFQSALLCHSLVPHTYVDLSLCFVKAMKAADCTPGTVPNIVN